MISEKNGMNQERNEAERPLVGSGRMPSRGGGKPEGDVSWGFNVEKREVQSVDRLADRSLSILVPQV